MLKNFASPGILIRFVQYTQSKTVQNDQGNFVIFTFLKGLNLNVFFVKCKGTIARNLIKIGRSTRLSALIDEVIEI